MFCKSIHWEWKNYDNKKDLSSNNSVLLPQIILCIYYFCVLITLNYKEKVINFTIDNQNKSIFGSKLGQIQVHIIMMCTWLNAITLLALEER